LSGRIVKNIARKYFQVAHQKVESRFSLLGGTGGNGAGAARREACIGAKELILILKPKRRQNVHVQTRAMARPHQLRRSRNS
jgi:hypothetical protein